MSPFVDVVTVRGYVWCETEGEAHAASEDPDCIGPQYEPDRDEEGHPVNWVQRTNHSDWRGSLWFYVCPGPHFPVFTMLETVIPKLPERGDLAALILEGDEETEGCTHEWIDARNEYVSSGEWCIRCNAIRAGNPDTRVSDEEEE